MMQNFFIIIFLQNSYTMLIIYQIWDTSIFFLHHLCDQITRVILDTVYILLKNDIGIHLVDFIKCFKNILIKNK